MTWSLQAVSKRVLGSLLLSTALAGCTVGPDDIPPKTELAPFHNVADGIVRKTAYWIGFGSA